MTSRFRIHTVQSGESLAFIARLYGMSWRELYEHLANAELRQLRPDPNKIYPGDHVAVPALNEAARRLGAFS